VLIHAAQGIAVKTPDPIQRADLLTTLAIFGKMAYPELNVLDFIGREQMKESDVIEEFLEEGRVEQGRHDLLQILKVNLGAAAAKEFAPALKHINHSNRLTRLQGLALRCSGLEQFRRGFEKHAVKI
jgi:hypothetical protein